MEARSAFPIHFLKIYSSAINAQVTGSKTVSSTAPALAKSTVSHGDTPTRKALPTSTPPTNKVRGYPETVFEKRVDLLDS
jgi:hypothetical protein